MNEEKRIDAPVALDDPDNPEWTERDFARAQPASALLGKAAEGLVRKRGRPPKRAEERKQQVTLRLSQDVLAAARKSGPGWQGRVDDALRRVFMRKSRSASAKKRA